MYRWIFTFTWRFADVTILGKLLVNSLPKQSSSQVDTGHLTMYPSPIMRVLDFITFFPLPCGPRFAVPATVKVILFYKLLAFTCRFKIHYDPNYFSRQSLHNRRSLITETIRVEWTDRLAATSKKEWTTIEEGKERMGVHRVLLYLWLHQYLRRENVWKYENPVNQTIPNQWCRYLIWRQGFQNRASHSRRIC